MFIVSNIIMIGVVDGYLYVTNPSYINKYTVITEYNKKFYYINLFPNNNNKKLCSFIQHKLFAKKKKKHM